MPELRALATGAELRVSGSGSLAVVCVNGGQGAEVPGTWSATLEWLVARLVPRFPGVRFGEVRYRIKSWKRLELCIADTRAAVAELRCERTLLLGFSMGGAVSVAAADEGSVSAVLGLAPWIPDRLDLSPLDGRRLDIIHGALDRWLPGIPGVSTSSSRRGFERARRRGVEGSYTVIPGAVHGIAVRSPGGRLVPLPRARRWVELVTTRLERFQGAGTDNRRLD